MGLKNEQKTVLERNKKYLKIRDDKSFTVKVNQVNFLTIPSRSLLKIIKIYKNAICIVVFCIFTYLSLNKIISIFFINKMFYCTKSVKNF